MYHLNIVTLSFLIAGLVSSKASFLQPRVTGCQYRQSGNGTCISTSSCAGTNVAGLCPGGNDIQCCVRTCSAAGSPGFCQSTSSPCTGGIYSGEGHCPGVDDIQCCVATCSTDSGDGVCQWIGSTCEGKYISGACPGPSDVRCCVSGATPGPGAGVPGIDISDLAPSSFWGCAATKWQVVVIQGYIQGCSVGGLVNRNFVANYNAAKAAGIPRIDTYLFPCTGTQDTGVACKPPATQIAELFATVDSNGMNISRYWFDLEPTPGGECNAWNIGKAANEALAKQWVAALESSGRPWGIYANGNQWDDMFASRSTDIGSQLPLWAVQQDLIPGVDTVTTFMGGWTSAVAKQFNLDTTDCGWTGGVDFDSFL
ncbi:glycoside hydrolase family 25 protein [Cadophora sp. MPI-SDFR-AT-0126]|nr:glycoside hydrolase family 25 protein [Leotiomycetes sp. MPI-SDFR-AT-0126]